MPTCGCPNGAGLTADGQCMCPPGTRFFLDSNSCVAAGQVGMPPNLPGDEGDTCKMTAPQPSCGRPINPGTGNMWHTERDDLAGDSAASLRIARTYNSYPYDTDASAVVQSAVVRAFGMRWTQPYDSTIVPQAASTSGLIGTCWQRKDTMQIWCENPIVLPPSGTLPAAVAVVRADGKKYLFNRNGTSWVPSSDVVDQLSATYNADNTAVTSWAYVSAKGDSTERYDANGRLISITARNGVMQRLTYSNGTTNDTSVARVPADAPVCTHVQAGTVLPAGRLLCVTDSWGRQINFEYDSKGRITKLLDPANQATLYAYDGPSGGCSNPNSGGVACAASNLTSVTYPDSKTRTYYYNEAAQINNGTACPNVKNVGNGFGHLVNTLTGVVDENNARYLSWTYDCMGRALSSVVGNDMEKVTLAYGTPDSTGSSITTVTHTLGTTANPQTTTRSYGYQIVLGIAKNTSIDGACVECGPYKARTYDANGNLKTATDWNGNVTTYTYDLTRNLETQRVEAFGKPEARTISTQWHPTYRLPAKIAEPKKLTTFSYDDHGNLQTKTEQATTDTTGVQGFNATTTGTPRQWQYTYNQYGQVLTAKGPRTDLDDTTTYTYDSTTGNLLTVKNAAGLVTKFGNYDANGRVGRITDPNGLVTDLTYWPRGWLKSKTVTGNYSAETTTYEYDNAGQLTQVTLPDSVMHYRYDDAHRLTDISDSLGNSIHYTLDLRGNRTREEVKDAKGILARQVTRVFDALSRLQQVTGAAQ